ncbi:MAG: TrpB-like pyridoxal phosphate-dependent enzyme [Planctomycetaceae bacterium]|nr:TrpB-like pyridoxal phosphate-dependent enzyme [Planctomycetaceae bacterium]
MDRIKIVLDESEIPRQWYNVAADLPSPLDPPLGRDNKPIGPADLAPIFPAALIEQEMSTQRWIDIPQPVLEKIALYRPTGLFRAVNLEKLLGTPAKIFYKYEGQSPTGSHKSNTATAQAYYNAQAGMKRLTTETGAGQWGSALSLACHQFGLACTVYMVRCSYDQKPFRKVMMQVWGAECIPSPSNRTAAGRAILKETPDTSGSLGMAISEAVEDAASHADANYALGSVLNHVMLHQTVIGLETKAALKKFGASPDVIIGCAGGGSNFAGIAFPFVPDKLGGQDIRIIAVEPSACPTMTEGLYRYDYGDTAAMTPQLKMYTLGHQWVPPAIHAGGLRYHGMSPLVSKLINLGVIEPVALHQTACFEGALAFAKCEGIIPAPESSHAVQMAIQIAQECKQTGQAKNIVFCLSGHGHFDMTAYQSYLAGNLKDISHAALGL